MVWVPALKPGVRTQLHAKYTILPSHTQGVCWLTTVDVTSRMKAAPFGGVCRHSAAFGSFRCFRLVSFTVSNACSSWPSQARWHHNDRTARFSGRDRHSVCSLARRSTSKHLMDYELWNHVYSSCFPPFCRPNGGCEANPEQWFPVQRVYPKQSREQIVIAVQQDYPPVTGRQHRWVVSTFPAARGADTAWLGSSVVYNCGCLGRRRLSGLQPLENPRLLTSLERSWTPPSCLSHCQTGPTCKVEQMVMSLTWEPTCLRSFTPTPPNGLTHVRS